MNTVHTPAHASCAHAAQGRPQAGRPPAAAGQEAAAPDLFAQLLADLQTDPPDASMAQAADAADGQADQPANAAQDAAAAAADFAPWLAGLAIPLAPLAEAASAEQTDAVSHTGPFTSPSDKFGLQINLSLQDVPEGPMHGYDGTVSVDILPPESKPARRSGNGVEDECEAPRSAGPDIAGDTPAASARAKGRDKAARSTGHAAAATDAPRSEQSWAALREAATHTGQAHGLRTLAAAAPAEAAAGPLAAEPAASAPRPSGETGNGQASLGSPSGHAAGTPAHETSGPAAEAALEVSFGQQLHEALQGTLDALGTQLAVWQAGRTQRASLTFEDGWDEALAVDVHVEDGVAHLSFRTDDGTVRQLIQAQAPQALADALARAGLALGQLDVGTRGQGQSSGEPPRQALRLGATVAAAGVGSAAGVGAPSHRPPRAAHTGVLDLYA